MCANVRAEIYIDGDVQEAGYRAAVMKVARKMKLSGFVENLPDGRVKIICEGPREVIEKFINRINIKTETIEAENITVSWHDATGEFEGFTVKISDLAQEMFQGYATAAKYFNITFKKQDETLLAIKDMHEDLGTKLDGMDNKLDSMDSKLGSIDGKLDVRSDELDNSIENLTATVNDKFDWLAERYGEFGEIMKSLNEKMDKIASMHDDIHEMKEAFVKLANYITSKK